MLAPVASQTALFTADQHANWAPLFKEFDEDGSRGLLRVDALEQRVLVLKRQHVLRIALQVFVPASHHSARDR